VAAGAAGENPLEALARLDEITRLLRRECPWDREQDERSIVPHTVEEAYELADAAHSGDDAKLLDELGDVLFQVLFLALLMEERGAGDLSEVADGCRRKLIRRHPHVFEDASAESSDDVLRSWDRIKRDDERGGDIFGEIPENLPSTLYARKALRRAEGAGHDWPAGSTVAQLELEAGRLASATTRGERFDAAGSLLLAAVAAARAVDADPELALRAATDRFMGTVLDEAGR